MSPATASVAKDQWSDLFASLEFVERRFADWAATGVLNPHQLSVVTTSLAERRQQWRTLQEQGAVFPADTGLARPRDGESAACRSLRYWMHIGHEVDRFTGQGLFRLAQTHNLLGEIQERKAVLERRLTPGDLPEVELAQLAETAAPPTPPTPPRPQRNLLEIILDPRSIQMLLALGGALTVVGLVLLLWVNEFFTPFLVACSLGGVNAGLMVLGWWLLRGTRYQLAGHALTLLACLVMPLNLWYYHANGLITLDHNLWMAGVVICALYAASALVLRDERFVYIFVAGVTLTGMLFLADLPPSPERFWEIAAPATMLVVMGLLAIHAERAFPEQEGPFGRSRFGMAFFRSGHLLLGAGLVLLFAAQVAGDWLFRPLFEALYRELHALPSPIVGELRWLALTLVLAATYAYIYSDVVVRHSGIHLYNAAATLLWTLVLALEVFDIALGIDALICVLAVVALVINLCEATFLKDSSYTRAFPIVAVALPLVAVALGVLVFFRALSGDLKSVWQVEPPSWAYVGALMLTAVSCRVGAYVHQQRRPALAAVYFFAAGGAVLVAATAALSALGLNTWKDHAPWLMVVPLGYLIAARIERAQEAPLTWVAHAATAVMLIASLASAAEGFALVHQQPLNLILALFFAEAAVFYALAAAFRQQVWAVNLCAAMACAAVWQLLSYAGVAPEYYTLTFALVGLALVVVYRLSGDWLADAAFRSGNTLLSLSFVGALLLGLSRLATHQIHWPLIGLVASLTLISVITLCLVRHLAWRRWYVVTSVAQAGLTFLGMSALSELSMGQKLEIFSVGIGLLLLIAGHLGWYREQERHNDFVSLSLFLGSLLVGVPLAIATMIDRSRDHFIALNELGFLAASVLLLASGLLFQLRSTTLCGAVLTAVYFVTLLIFIPWSRLNAVALFITIGGGTLFLIGLILSVYRDRLLTLPDRVKRREGLFRVLNWR